MTTNNAINDSSQKLTGMTGTISAPTGITSSAGASLLNFLYTVSAVNSITFLNNATGGQPVILGVGSDTNVILNIQGQGTGGVQIGGSTAGDNATPGFVGEFISSVIPNASPITATNGVAVNVTSVNLTAGDWLVYGNLNLTSGATTTTGFLGWTSITSATVPDASLVAGFNFASAIIANNCGFSVAAQRYSLSTTTTIFISTFTASVSGNPTVSGGIYARRLR